MLIFYSSTKASSHPFLAHLHQHFLRWNWQNMHAFRSFDSFCHLWWMPMVPFQQLKSSSSCTASFSHWYFYAFCVCAFVCFCIGHHHREQNKVRSAEPKKAGKNDYSFFFLIIFRCCFVECFQFIWNRVIAVLYLPELMSKNSENPNGMRSSHQEHKNMVKKIIAINKYDETYENHKPQMNFTFSNGLRFIFFAHQHRYHFNSLLLTPRVAYSSRALCYNWFHRVYSICNGSAHKAMKYE